MNTNQKSLAALSSPYLFGISQVGAQMAALAPKNVPQVRMWTVGQTPGVPASDGYRSNKRKSKSVVAHYCGDVIPANRTNRKARRAAAKFVRRMAQLIKVA